jgi:hypothetical protein
MEVVLHLQSTSCTGVKMQRLKSSLDTLNVSDHRVATGKL